MIIPANLPFAADRFTPFRTTINVVGEDLTDAVMEAHVRTQKDQPGDPLANLDAAATIADEGLFLVSVATVDGESVSTVSMHIDQETMEAWPIPGLDAEGELGDDLACWWDLHITPDGGLKRVYASGTFTLRAGVTMPDEWS